MNSILAEALGPFAVLQPLGFRPEQAYTSLRAIADCEGDTPLIRGLDKTYLHRFHRGSMVGPQGKPHSKD